MALLCFKLRFNPRLSFLSAHLIVTNFENFNLYLLNVLVEVIQFTHYLKPYQNLIIIALINDSDLLLSARLFLLYLGNSIAVLCRNYKL